MALVLGTLNQDGGTSNFASMRFTSDAVAAVATVFTLGFIPRYIKLVNITDLQTDEWFEGMAAATSFREVINGTKSLLGTNGFTVGTDGTITLGTSLIPANKTFNIIATA
jgi:hypothetical protein